MQHAKKIIAGAVAGVALAGYLGGNMVMNTKAQDALTASMKETPFTYTSIACEGWSFNPVCTIENYSYENIITLNKVTLKNVKAFADFEKNPDGHLDLNQRIEGIVFDFENPEAQQYIMLASLFVGHEAAMQFQEILSLISGNETVFEAKGAVHVKDDKLIKADRFLLLLGNPFFEVKTRMSLENKEGFGVQGIDGVYFYEAGFSLKNRQAALDFLQSFLQEEEANIQEVLAEGVAEIETLMKTHDQESVDWKALNAFKNVLAGTHAGITFTVEGKTKENNNILEDLFAITDLQELTAKNYTVTVTNTK